MPWNAAVDVLPLFSIHSWQGSPQKVKKEQYCVAYQLVISCPTSSSSPWCSTSCIIDCIYVIFCNVLILTFLTSLFLFFSSGTCLQLILQCGLFVLFPSLVLVWCYAGKIWWSSIYCWTSYNSQRERSGFYFSVLFVRSLITTLFCRKGERREGRKKERICLTKL